MIKRVKIFANNNIASQHATKVIKDKLTSNNFVIAEENYDLAIAVGGDGSFLRMIKSTDFNSNVIYVGVNLGTLGFLQEIKSNEIDALITELKNKQYKIEELSIQETTINQIDTTTSFYSLNEIVLRDAELNTLKVDISIDGYLLERFLGDGILVATSTGSTAHNLSYGGSIVYNTFSSLQITPIGPINSKVYRSLVNSVIIPEQKEITIIPNNKENNLLITIDGTNNFFDNVTSIITKINGKKIKCLRLSHYSFSEKINEKLLSK